MIYNMKNEYNAIDWQTFSQKKNIEEIVKNTRDKKDIQIAGVIELSIAIMTYVIDKVIPEFLKYNIVFIIITILTISPVAFLLSKYAYRWIKKELTPGKDLPIPAKMIDLFDNEVCYYVLMAESYSSELSPTSKHAATDLDRFYFIESCFYFNKAVSNLSQMTSNLEKIFSIDVGDLTGDKKISCTRLKNIFDILDKIQKVIESNVGIISSIDIDDNYYEVFSVYRKAYDEFKKNSHENLPMDV